MLAETTLEEIKRIAHTFLMLKLKYNLLSYMNLEYQYYISIALYNTVSDEK